MGKQAVRAAPTSATIKAGSQAAYKASERTGAIINEQAMQLLSHDMQNLARMQGLVMPSGKLASAFPKVANAIRTVREYAQGSMGMEEAQTLLRTLRTAQKSADPDEARLGNMMVNQFEDFLDGLEAALAGWMRGNRQTPQRPATTAQTQRTAADTTAMRRANEFAADAERNRTVVASYPSTGVGQPPATLAPTGRTNR